MAFSTLGKKSWLHVPEALIPSVSCIFCWNSRSPVPGKCAWAILTTSSEKRPGRMKCLSGIWRWRHSLEYFSDSRDVKAYAQSYRLNLEEAGRDLRYAFLRKTAAGIGAAKIATAHTLNDQAETFIMRLLRGSGLRGLAGIAPIRDDLIIRPMIQVEREKLKLTLRRGISNTGWIRAILTVAICATGSDWTSCPGFNRTMNHRSCFRSDG